MTCKHDFQLKGVNCADGFHVTSKEKYCTKCNTKDVGLTQTCISTTLFNPNDIVLNQILNIMCSSYPFPAYKLYKIEITALGDPVK